MKILYPTVSLRRYENGWSYNIEKIWEETSGVHADGTPLVLHLYAQGPSGESGKQFVLRLEEESK